MISISITSNRCSKILSICYCIRNRDRTQNEINTQLLKQVFQCLTYLFKYLWRIMLKDLASLYELYSKFLFSSSTTNASTTNYEYIHSFAAESFAYLLRKIENYQISYQNPNSYRNGMYLKFHQKINLLVIIVLLSELSRANCPQRLCMRRRRHWRPCK